MKKIFLLLILLFAFYLGGCNNEPIENKTNTIITTTTESPKYNVIFDFLDSDIENISIKVDVNSIIPLEKIPSIPDKKGYTSKWLYDNEYITKDNTIIEVSYEPIIYTINYYNIDKNIENPNPISYIIEDENIVLSDISKNGYEFIGWNNGGSYVTEVDPKECIDIYLSPSFEIIEYTITYNLNDIIDSEDEEEVKKYKAYNSNPEKYTVESSFTFNEPTRLGFTFTGWEKEEIEKGTTGDIILNARWEVAKYKVTVTNNLTDSIEETILEYGNSFEFEPTLVEGYTICTIKENDTIVDPNIDFINKDHSYIVYYISTDYEFEIQEFKEYITSSMYYTLKYITMTGYKGTSRNITIPDVIEAIGSKVISEDYPIDTITIGSNIKVIDYAAFDTSSLKAIYIPKTVKTIENDAFRFDDVVVFFEGTMEEWDKYDYMDIGYTKGIVVPNSTYSEMTYVKNENKSYILKDNKAYGYIDIDTTNTIYDFNNETVEIISIGKSFLSGCSNIKIIVIPDKVETIYFKSSNTYLFIPKSIKNIYYNYANYLYEGSIEDFSKVSVDSIYDTKIVYNIIPSNPSFIKTDDYEYLKNGTDAYFFNYLNTTSTYFKMDIIDDNTIKSIHNDCFKNKNSLKAVLINNISISNVNKNSNISIFIKDNNTVKEEETGVTIPYDDVFEYYEDTEISFVKIGSYALSVNSKNHKFDSNKLNGLTIISTSTRWYTQLNENIIVPETVEYLAVPNCVGYPHYYIILYIPKTIKKVSLPSYRDYTIYYEGTKDEFMSILVDTNRSLSDVYYNKTIEK